MEEEMLTAETVAYWYLRLNGFLLLKNFLVHGDRSGYTRTDIDHLGVRFKHRCEHLRDPMKDDDWIEQKDSTIVVFCEVKRGADGFNDAWFSKDRKMMESFLALVGLIPQGTEAWQNAVVDLYEHGAAQVFPEQIITLLLINEDPEGIVSDIPPRAKNISLSHALEFIHRRFDRYSSIKTDHGQWNASGTRLWNLWITNRRDRKGFVDCVLDEI